MIKYTKKKLLTLLVQSLATALLIYTDLFIKNIVVENIPYHGDVPFWEGVIGWTYEQNTGMAWSLFSSSPEKLSVFVLILLAVLAVVMILPIKRPFIYEICLPLIISGGAANLIDRLQRGFVVDYIKTLYIDFPIYNFADCLITVGAFSMVIYLIYEIISETVKEKRAKSEGKENE